MHSRWSMRPSSSIDSESQPDWQALHVVHSSLRFNPHQRKVEGMASAAPSGHRYLQKKRSTNRPATNKATQKSTNGQLRFHTPTRKVVLNGSTSDRISARPIE